MIRWSLRSSPTITNKCVQFSWAPNSFSRNLSTDRRTLLYNGRLGAAILKEEFHKAEQAFSQMKSRSVPLNGATYSHMIHCYAKLGDVQKLDDFYSSMKKDKIVPTLVGYSILIHFYGRKKNVSKMMEIYEDMKANANSLPKEKLGKLYHSMMKMFEADNDLINLNLIHKDMCAFGIVPTMQTLLSMLEAGERCKNWKMMNDSFFEMKKYSYKPEQEVVIKMIKCFGMLGEIEKMMALYRTLIIQWKQARDRVDPSIFEWMTQFCCQKGKVKELIQVLEHMESIEVVMGQSMYCHVIQFFAKRTEAEPMTHAFEDMIKHGHVPDTTTFNMMLYCYGKKDLLQTMPIVWKQMIELGVEPNYITTNIMKTYYGKYETSKLLQETLSPNQQSNEQ